jgi:hypothetical protein
VGSFDGISDQVKLYAFVRGGKYFCDKVARTVETSTAVFANGSFFKFARAKTAEEADGIVAAARELNPQFTPVGDEAKIQFFGVLPAGSCMIRVRIGFEWIARCQPTLRFKTEPGYPPPAEQVPVAAAAEEAPEPSSSST